MSKPKFIDETKSIDPAFFEHQQRKPFSQILYDKKAGTVLGRDTKSWGKILFGEISEYFFFF